MSTKLSEYLRACTPEERQATAEHIGTSVNMLYQYAGGHRGPGVKRALAIVSAVRAMRKMNRRLPAVRVEDLAGCEVRG